MFWADYATVTASTATATQQHAFNRVNVGDPVGVIGLTKTPGKLIAAAKAGFAVIDLRNAKNGGRVELEYRKKVYTDPEQFKV